MGILQSQKSKSGTSKLIDPFDYLDDSYLEKGLFADFGATPSRGTPQSAAKKPVDNLSASRHAQAPVKPRQAAPRRGLPMESKVTLARNSRSLGKYLLVAALVGLTGFAVARTKLWSYFGTQELVYAYFEVRALDASGRPIAGAVVKNAGKRVGTTDSFGEWRRYMRVPLGSTIPVTIAKKTSAELLFATKNFAVPLEKPEKSEIELRGSVQLMVADQDNTVAKTAVQVAPNDMMRVTPKDNNAPKEEPTLSAVNSLSSAELSSAELSSAAPAPVVSAPAAVTSVETAPVPAFVSSHESIWFEGSGSLSAPLNKEVLPALIARAKEVGLRVNPAAAWKVRLTGLLDKPSKIEKEGGGLIMVTSFDGDNGGVVRDFLRNYQADARVTARGILYILARHVNKNVSVVKRGDKWLATLPASSSDLWRLAPGMSLAGPGKIFSLTSELFTDGKAQGYFLNALSGEPCVTDARGCDLKTRSFAETAPVPAWARLRLQFQAPGKEQMKIFVSGYEAKLVGDRVYEFWGQDKVRANVTVVQGGRVVSRSQIVGDTRNPARLSLTTISRR